MVCGLINLSVQWRPWKELSSWETQLELRMACYLQYFIIKVLSILNDEQLSIAIQNTAKFRMQGNLYCGEGSHLRDRKAVRLRDSIYLHFALTDWKQAGFPETWLWKHPRGSLMRLGPSNFPQKCIFTLSALWMCRAVAFCKHSRKEVAQKSWPSFPHPWTQWKHTLLQATQFLSLVPASTSSPHPRVFFFFSLLCLPGWILADLLGTISEESTEMWKSSWAKAISGGSRVAEAVSQLTSCGWEHKLSDWSALGNVFHTFLVLRVSRVH